MGYLVTLLHWHPYLSVDDVHLWVVAPKTAPQYVALVVAAQVEIESKS